MKNLTVQHRRLLRRYLEEHLGDVSDFIASIEDHQGRSLTVKDGATYVEVRREAVAIVEDMITRL